MIEIRIHGRGGQGGVTLAKLLATAQHQQGKSVQAFGIYAAERSGAPLAAYLRYDDQPVHNPNQIYEPDHIIVLDPTLISPKVLSGLKPGGLILMNSDQPPQHYVQREQVKSFRIATIDATAIALKNKLGSRSVPIVNTALAGAAARMLDIDLDSVLTAFTEMGFHAGNRDAAVEAYQAVRHVEPAVQADTIHKATTESDRIAGIINGNAGLRPAIHTGEWANQQPLWENATPPCNFICPAGNDVQGFLAALTGDDVDGALEILLRSTPFPSVCGRVCPGFCMMECNRAQLDGAVNVRALERFAGDHGKATVPQDPERPERVAVIGSGPAGLSSAYHLAKMGYQVTVIEAGDQLGGLMRTGIPAYRLPDEALDRDIARILGLGVRVILNTRIDHDGLLELTREYDAVLAATGLQRLTPLNLGNNIKNVMQGIEYLDSVKSNAVNVRGEKVLVIGGGNTAVDAARSAFRQGADEVRIVYRRTREEMPAITEEVDDAIDEGIRIDFLCSPLRIESDSGQQTLLCQRMQLGEPDESGRRRPVAIPDSEFQIPCDRVILALGQAADMSLLPKDAVLSKTRPVEPEGPAGNLAPLFAAGDLLTNEGTVTAAIGCGQDMALQLHQAFSGEHLHDEPLMADSVVRADQIHMQHFQLQQQHKENILPFAGRQASFDEVRQGLDSVEEAKRCLSCGVCNACDRCVTYCPDGVLRREGNQIIFDYDYCKGCGVCVTECSRAVIFMKAGQHSPAVKNTG
jgi:2-oxoacid:acceptor oxidoreductase gamma subunit (pyruvate/2-ketoisovalerate family)